ncbi:Oligosaccharide translocation protein RFT1 [Erysiphe neolycopersici]|uniref:Man(5)GlcNAc(2)-PP-dolichol translocation protein RFT1 n=1 Tax=Erysiphe neolycopersici TaxID=212602 RepID=A0A420I2W6_9PEZI|nr:Oligosaccharide translocation protein RFT1 [Erysiphe neolycopersici]
MSSQTLTNAILLIAQQFGSRCLTFLANQILLRYLSPEILGISTQLELYSVTVLFFSRESLRITLQRHQIDPSVIHHSHPKPITKENGVNGSVNSQTAAGQIQAAVNLAYISLALGITLSFTLAWLFLGSLSNRDSTIVEVPFLKMSLILFGGASILELLAEPCYVVVQLKSRQYIRIASESTATVLRCVVTCISAIYGFNIGLDIGVLPFALGQLAYSISLVILYYWKVTKMSSKEGFSLLPRSIQLSKTRPTKFLFSYFSHPVLSLCQSFFIQSLFKYVLTQGDTFIISILASPNIQGIYSLANNYGGLVARLILQPIEEISRNYFGKLLSTTNKNSQQVILKVQKSLLQSLYTYLIFSIFVVSLGPTAAPLILKIIAGHSWSKTGAGKVLALYCYYIPLLAINGIVEAFVSSVATESEVHQQTAWMLLFSIIFSGAAFIFLKVYQLGAQGIVVANSINMIFRIIWAIIFIKSYLWRWKVDLKLNTLIPRPLTLSTGVVVSAIFTQIEIGDDGLSSLFKIAATAGILFVFMYVNLSAYFFKKF